MKKLLFLSMFLCSSLLVYATHYINKTGRSITVTNISEKKRYHRKHMWSWGGSVAKKQSEFYNRKLLYSIDLENGQEGDLNNQQGDEIRITSHGLNDHRKLFPTNNSFNYVITMNKYKNKYERFDINHAG